MSPDRDPGRRDDDGRELDHYGEEPPRSLFSALWFRALLAILVLGILAAVAVPYLLDVATSPSLKASAKPVSPAGTPAATEPTAAPAPSPTVTAPAPAAPESTVATGAAPTATAAAPTATAAAPAVTEPAPSATAAPRATPAAVAKAAPAKATKVAEAPKQPPKAAATKPSSAKAAIVAATGGPYWVQVGAFKDPETAKRLVARLREQGLSAEESSTGPAGSTGPSGSTGPAGTTDTVAPRPSANPPASGPSGDRYDVVVSGASAADVDAKLATKGMTGETTPNGIVVRPSLPLREAVALSRELADGGLSVQVRRVGGPAPVPAPAPQVQAPTPAATPAPAPAGGVTLHRVRVGGFPDRATAMAAAKQLEEKGFKTFIARRAE